MTEKKTANGGELATDVVERAGSASKPVLKQAQPQNISELITAALPLADRYVKLREDEFASIKQRDETAGKHNRKLTYALLVFLGLIIAVMAALTFAGKVTGEALLFLIGIFVGYIINMVQGLIYLPWESETGGD